MKSFAFDESWEIIRKVFPDNLDQVARESGSFRRARRVGDAETLLRLLLMHGSGLSLEQAVLRAREQGLSTISAVGLFKRLRRSEAFLQKLAGHVLEQVQQRCEQGPWPGGYRYRIIDATTVNEPGATGSSWRIHYSLRLPDLYCDHFELTSPEQGESFKRWPAAANEVLLADRAYSHREAVGALIDHGAKVVVRLNRSVFPLLEADGQLFEPLVALRALVTGEAREWHLFFSVGQKIWPIRLSAIRKTELAAERAKEKARRKAQRQQVQIQPETLEFCEYVLVLTNLEEPQWSAAKVLELYRCRWQVELAFKRLKSLLKLGYLPKKDPASARAWMQLKLLIALVTEKLCYDARFFSPWGC